MSLIPFRMTLRNLVIGDSRDATPSGMPPRDPSQVGVPYTYTVFNFQRATGFEGLPIPLPVVLSKERTRALRRTTPFRRQTYPVNFIGDLSSTESVLYHALTGLSTTRRGRAQRT